MRKKIVAKQCSKEQSACPSYGSLGAVSLCKVFSYTSTVAVL